MAGRAGGGSSFKTIATLTLIPIAGLVALLLWNVLNGGAPPEEILKIDTQPDAEHLRAAPASEPATETGIADPAVHVPEPPASKSAEASALPRVTPRRSMPAGTGGELVLIIDDLGFEGQPLQRLMSLDPDISMSVLPNADRAAEFAERLNDAGFEVMCHLPMEPIGGARPGRGALLTSMDDEELARLTLENVARVPYARGVNNHMGSKATRDSRVMNVVLRAIPRGLYFVDSRTAGGSVAASTASALGVPTATRDVFLDDTPTEAAVTEQLARAVELARSGKTAIAIGHPHRATIEVLERELPRLKAQGMRIVRASQAVR